MPVNSRGESRDCRFLENLEILKKKKNKGQKKERGENKKREKERVCDLRIIEPMQ